jgi:hypothetical protein
LRVTVTCVMPDQCPDDAVQTVRDTLASSTRAWGDLKIDYAFESHQQDRKEQNGHDRQ